MDLVDIKKMKVTELKQKLMELGLNQLGKNNENLLNEREYKNL